MAIETIPAGRETDRQIAESLFGWKRVEPPTNDGFQALDWLRPTDRRNDAGHCSELVNEERMPRYSASDTAALEVVEALRQRGWLVVLKAMPDGLPFLAGAGMGPGEGQEIRVRYVASGQWMKHLTPTDTGLRVSAHPVGMADTLALAVCRAALQCVSAEREAER